MELEEEMKVAYHAEAIARGWSPRTWVGREDQVEDFFRFCSGLHLAQIADVTPEVVEAYRRDLAERLSRRGRPLVARTQQTMLVCLRGFFRFLVRSSRILVDPCRDLVIGKAPSTLPEVLTLREARRLLATIDDAGALGVRDRAIVACLYETGMRLGELVGLTLADIDWDAGTLTIRHAKGATDRVVPMGEALRAALMRYTTEARHLPLERAARLRWSSDPERLFLSARGRALDPTAVEDRVTAAARRAGLRKRVTPHTLRHSCATHLVAAGADLRLVQELLGHRRLSSTEHYTRLSVTDLKSVHRRNHPREKEAGTP